MSAPSRLSLTWTLLKKDLQTEFRAKDTLITLFFFGFLQIVIFTFSFWSTDEIVAAVSPGILWITIAFTGVIGIERSFAREQEGQTLTALVLVPGVKQALYVAKTFGNILFIGLVELLVVPLVVGVLNVPIKGVDFAYLALTLVLGTVGFAAVGTVFSAMLAAVKRRGALLPIVLYPVVIPLIVMGVKATGALVEHRPYEEYWSWIKLMLVVDVLYVVVGGLLFPSVLEDD